MYKLCIYTRVKVFGGEEEGGWHYNVLQLVSSQEVDSKEKALEWFKRMQKELKNSRYYVAGITRRHVRRELANSSTHYEDTYYSELGLIAAQHRGPNSFC